MINQADVSLFFKIKADASEASAEISQLPEGLQRVLNKLAKQLSISEKAINSHSKRTRELGDSTARTANRLDNLSNNAKKLYGRIVEASAKFVSGETSAKQFSNAIRSVAAQSDNLRTRIKASAASIQDFQTKVETAARKTAEVNFKKLQSNLGSLASGLQNVGRTLAASVTLPLVGLAAWSIKSADALFVLRNKVFSVTGSMDVANQKINEFITLAKSNVGVTADMAAENYAFFKILEVNEDKIPNLITALGKLKTLAPELPIEQMRTNLTQLFNENFEIKDMRELLGKVPVLGKILAEKFGAEGVDPSSLQKVFKDMRANGKLTMDSFLEGFADAVNNDSALSKLEDGFFAKLSKLMLPVQIAFEPLGNSIISAIEPVIPYLVSFLETLSKGFSSLSPTFQLVVVGIGAIAAAAGPVLIALGSILGSIVSIGAGLTFLTGTATVGAALSAVGAALLSIAPIIAGIVVVVGTLAAVVTAFALAWQNDFGKIRTITLEVFESVKNTILPIMTAVSDFVRDKVEQIVSWWEDNYPLIQETVETVSNFIESSIRVFLDAVSGLWESHGESVTGYVSRAWNRSQEIITSVIEVIGNILKLGMQIINGDWEGAWNTYLETLEGTIRTVVSVVNGYFRTMGELFLKIIALVVEYTIKFNYVLFEGMMKAITGAVNILATLPQQIEKLIPKLVAAGTSIANAIWQGIKDGLTGRGDIPVPQVKYRDEFGSGNVVGSSDFDIPDSRSERSASKPPPTNDKLLKKQQQDAEKAAKERARAASQEIADQITLLENQLDRAKDLYRETFDDIREEFDKTGKISLFDDELVTATQRFGDEINTIIPSLQALELQAASAVKKTVTQFKILAEEQEKRIDEVSEFSDKIQKERAKLLGENVKKESKERLKVSQESLETELRQQENIVRAKQAFLDAQHARGMSSEAAYQESKRKLILDYTKAVEQDGQLISIELSKSLLNFRYLTLSKQLEAVKGNAEKELDIRKQLADVWSEIQVEYFNQAASRAEETKKSLEEQTRLAEELIKIQKDLNQVERERVDFRQDQTRKTLENSVGIAFGKEKIKALTALRDFDIADADRRRIDRQIDLDSEKQVAFDKIRGKANELEQKKALEDVYREESLLSEEEFQVRLKEIQDRFKSEMPQSPMETLLGGFLGQSDADVFAGIGDMISSTFNSMAQAAGNAVAAFVKFGSAGGSFKKFAAEIIASIAQMATVQAVWNLAEGFAKLAMAFFGHPTAGASATQHFIAAGIYGTIAGVSAIAGRAVAGNSFQDQSNNSFSGRANNSSGSGTFSNSNQTNETKNYDENRINRQERPATKTYVFQVPRGMVSQAVMNDFNSAGPIRDGILKMVEG